MGTPRITRVPEVYNQLLDLYRAEPEIDPHFLMDGWATVNDISDYLIFFGYRHNAQEWINVGRAATAGLDAQDIETVTIGVLIAAVHPTHDMRAARDKAASKFAPLQRIVTVTPNLGLSGVKATIDSHAWQPLHTTKGAECDIAVDVKIEVTL
jgi:hypothetical protein